MLWFLGCSWAAIALTSSVLGETAWRSRSRGSLQVRSQVSPETAETAEAAESVPHGEHRMSGATSAGEPGAPERKQKWRRAIRRSAAAAAMDTRAQLLEGVPRSTAKDITPYEVNCSMVTVPGLYEKLPLFDKMRICYPNAPGTYPLHLFAHGDAGGGLFFLVGYRKLQQELASFGFVVAAYLSCWFDRECDGGKGSFLEALKTLDFLEKHPDLAPVDWTLPHTASGHSTGGRAVLMLAALRDNPDYLKGTKWAKEITPSMRLAIKRIKAVCADFPDPMNDAGWNPDVAHFNINETAVFVITGSRDTWIEPEGSSWINFKTIKTPDKVFINVKGAGHLEPFLYHREAKFIAYYSRYYALGDREARNMIYGDGPDALRRKLPLAGPGDDNLGEGKIAFLACSRNETPVPEEYGEHCPGPVAAATPSPNLRATSSPTHIAS